MTETRIDDIRYVLTAVVGFGWVLSTVLWLADLGVAAVWVTFSVAVLTAIDFVLYFHLHTNLAAWAAVFVVTMVAVLFSIRMNARIAEKEIESEETPTHGVLVPANDPTPVNACSQAKATPPPGALLILLGSDSFWSLTDLVPLRLGDCTSVEVKRRRDGLFISADLFAEDGRLVAHIKDNEFHLVQNEISYREERDRSTLAVHDPKGKEALYVRYINVSTFAIRGRFFCSDSSIVITPDGTVTFNNARFKRMKINNMCAPWSKRGITFGPNGLAM